MTLLPDVAVSGHISNEQALSIGRFQKRPKDGAEIALCSNLPTGPVDLYESKRSQRHLLTNFENDRTYCTLPI